MLKLLYNSSANGRLLQLSPLLRPSTCRGGCGGRSPIAAAVRSLRGSYGRRSVFLGRLFSSESDDAAAAAAEVGAVKEEGAEDADAKSPSAIVPTNPRPEDYLTVLAVPLPHRPLFPGFYLPVFVKDPKLLAALIESRKRQAPYAGAFLLKDDSGSDPKLGSGLE